MKIASAVNTFDSNMSIKSEEFTIKASPKAFQILSSNIYKRKELAVVRELLANALDAHTAAGKQDTPVQIHMPTAIEPFFEIKDFGPGLSNAGIHTLYTSYFSSSKTESNDEIGGLGLGSKSPFAYTDQFFVESRFNGVNTQYQVFIAENGVPNITPISSVPTIEPNGLTVRVPVAAEDATKFKLALEELAPYIQAEYHCNISITPETPKYAMEFELNNNIVLKLRTDHKSRCVMAFVPYTLDTSVFEYDSPVRAFLSSFQFDLIAPIGTFDIQPSREELSYDKETIARLESAIEQTMSSMVGRLEGFMKEAKTLVEAAHVRSTLFNGLHTFANRSRVVDPTLTERLKTLESQPTFGPTKRSLHIRIDPALKVYSIRNSWRGSKVHRTEVGADQANLIRYNRVGWSHITEAEGIYWAPKNRPFSQFFQEGPGKLDSIMIVGDRTLAEQFVKSIDRNPSEIEEIPVMKITRQGNRTGLSGATKYDVWTINNTHEGATLAADIPTDYDLVILCDNHSDRTDKQRDITLLNYLTAGAVSMTHTRFVDLHASHSKVRSALLKEQNIWESVGDLLVDMIDYVNDSTLAELCTRNPVDITSNVVNTIGSNYLMALADVDDNASLCTDFFLYHRNLLNMYSKFTNSDLRNNEALAKLMLTPEFDAEVESYLTSHLSITRFVKETVDHICTMVPRDLLDLVNRGYGNPDLKNRVIQQHYVLANHLYTHCI